MALSKKLKALLCLLVFLPVTSLLASEYNMREGATEISQMAYDLHMLVIYVVTIIGILTFGVMFYSMWAHRRSNNPEPAKFSHSTSVEVIWTAIPLIILVALAFPATKTLLLMEDTETDADMTVLITGSQWKWHYKYLDGDQKDIEFFSVLATPRSQIEDYDGQSVGREENANYLLEVDNPLVIPVGKKVRFLMTSDDVIHSWWVPDFAVKKDTIPGFINEAWTEVPEPGTFRGQCTELCGKDHGFMPIVVEAKTESDFAAWVSGQKDAIAEAQRAAMADNSKVWTKDELMGIGEERYTAVCAACHQVTGAGMPPMFPALAGSPFTTTGPVEDHIDILLYGRAGTAMQAFGSQLTDAEIAAVVTYTRNAWGNDTGDIVQPADVAARKKQ
ncbi:MAG: cytochrome c oxidase subunit II [Gammaproteobacteria bacterium]|nr:cytochrome c oxidase subunit II [Gammaproteobacteria bacterium]